MIELRLDLDISNKKLAYEIKLKSVPRFGEVWLIQTYLGLWFVDFKTRPLAEWNSNSLSHPDHWLSGMAIHLATQNFWKFHFSLRLGMFSILLPGCLPRGGIINGHDAVIFYSMTSDVIVIFLIEWRPLVTNRNISVIVIVTVRLDRYKLSVILICQFKPITEIERILNNATALPNINNSNPLRHNDDLCRHPIVILLEVVNDAAPCYLPTAVMKRVLNRSCLHWKG